MKTIGKLAIIFAVIFIGCAIAGGVCTVIGGVQYLNDSDIPENIGGFVADHGAQIEDILGSIGNGLDETCESSMEVSMSDAEQYVNIRNAVGDISVVSGDADRLAVYYDGPDSLNFGIEENEDGFDIAFSGGEYVVSLGNIMTGEIRVELPESYHGELNFIDSVGDIDIEKSGFTQLSFENVVGDIEAEGCDVYALTMKDCTGNIELSGEIKGFALSSVTGDIDIESTCPPEMECVIDSNLGDIKIELPLGSNVKLEESGNMGGVNVVGANNTGAANACVINAQNNLGAIVIEIGD